MRRALHDHPQVLLAELIRGGKLLGPRSLIAEPPECVASVACHQDGRSDGSLSLCWQIQTLKVIYERSQDVQGPRQIVLQGLLHVWTFWVTPGCNAFQCAGAVQAIRSCHLASALHIIPRCRPLARVSTLHAVVDAGVRCILTPLPEELRGLDVATALCATRRVQRLQVRFEPLIAPLGSRQLRQRRCKIDSGWRSGRERQRETRDGMVDSHE